MAEESSVNLVMTQQIATSNGTDSPNKRVRKGTNSPNKNFEPHWDEEDVISGLLDGTLFEGAIRINAKNYKEAYIASPDGTEDILIEGLLNRNRALNDDIVVCQLIVSSATNNPTASPVKSKSLGTPKNSPAVKPPSTLKSTPKVEATEKPKENGSKNKKKTLKKDAEKAEALLSEGNPIPLSDVQCTEAAATVVDATNTPSPAKKKRVRPNRKEKSALKENRSKEEANQDVEKQIVDETPVSSTSNGAQQAESVDPPAATTPSQAGKDSARKRTRRSGRKNKKNGNDKENSATVEEETVNSVIGQLTSLEVNDSPPLLLETSLVEVKEEVQSRKTAKVVFIKEKNHSRRAIGHLQKWPYGSSNNWVMFSPKDHRIPRFRIPFSSQLASCMTVPSMLFLAQIVDWDDVNHPLGSLCYYVGLAGDIEAETIAILLQHDTDYGPFPQKVLESLPELPWSIPAEEIEKRKDFRDHCIFTIDPSDARDLDDAVCGRFLKTAEDGVTEIYQISVHIADVSFFVKEGTDLDELASQRATSTYLVDRVIPMLPSVLCEHVCSLNPGEDRLAFSVEWIINDKGEILEEWFGRSIIRSCVKLSYDHAQAVIEEKEEINWPEIKGPHTESDIRTTIQVLQKLAGHLRKKRVDNGALRIDLPRLHFSMDWETRTPIGFRLYELKDSNRLIEEFMLLANMRVAEKIYKSFPSIAVLRCHPCPSSFKMQHWANTLEAIGIHLDVSSSAALQESLIRYGQSSDDPLALGRNLVISNMVAKPMKPAIYICSGNAPSEEFFRHYALSVPFYTHFTSPIRRYPDILVHRLLDAALLEDSLKHWEQPVVRK
nr:EOG090X047D [Chydorus sphaericus]